MFRFVSTAGQENETISLSVDITHFLQSVDSYLCRRTQSNQKYSLVQATNLCAFLYNSQLQIEIFLMCKSEGTFLSWIDFLYAFLLRIIHLIFPKVSYFKLIIIDHIHLIWIYDLCLCINVARTKNQIKTLETKYVVLVHLKFCRLGDNSDWQKGVWDNVTHFMLNWKIPIEKGKKVLHFKK